MCIGIFFECVECGHDNAIENHRDFYDSNIGRICEECASYPRIFTLQADGTYKTTLEYDLLCNGGMDDEDIE